MARKILALLFLLAAAASASITTTVSQPTATTAASPVAIKASATSSTAIKTWEVWLDGTKVYSLNTSATSMTTSITLTGTAAHRVVVRAVNAAGEHGDKVLSLTRAPSNLIPVPPATAKLYTQVEDMTGWQGCSQCAADPNKSNPPIATYSMAQNQSSPAQDGSSTKFALKGPAYADVLHWRKLSSTADLANNNYLWDFWLYIDDTSSGIINLESDLYAAVSSQKYMFGAQCNFNKGAWQADWETGGWINLPAPCTRDMLRSKQWHHVRWYFTRSPNVLHYKTVEVDGHQYSLNVDGPSKWSDWSDTLGVQFQQDLGSSGSSGTAEWVDAVKLWTWSTLSAAEKRKLRREMAHVPSLEETLTWENCGSTCGASNPSSSGAARADGRLTFISSPSQDGVAARFELDPIDPYGNFYWFATLAQPPSPTTINHRYVDYGFSLYIPAQYDSSWRSLEWGTSVRRSGKWWRMAYAVNKQAGFRYYDRINHGWFSMGIPFYGLSAGAWHRVHVRSELFDDSTGQYVKHLWVSVDGVQKPCTGTCRNPVISDSSTSNSYKLSWQNDSDSTPHSYYVLLDGLKWQTWVGTAARRKGPRHHR